jgi:hypothetical protein
MPVIGADRTTGLALRCGQMACQLLRKSGNQLINRRIDRLSLVKGCRERTIAVQ